MDSLYGKVPRDRLTLNSWIRSFYLLNPIVHNAVLFHAICSISRFRIIPKDSSCFSALRRLDLVEPAEDEWLKPGSKLLDLAKEYWKLGEVFPHLEFGTDQNYWSCLTILNPDYVFVKRSLSGNCTLHLRPDAVLRKIATSTDPADDELKRGIPEHVLLHVIKDKYIPLDERCVSHILCSEDPYDIRGTSMIVSVINDLLAYDAMRERSEVDINKLEMVKDSIRAGMLFSPKLLKLAKERHAIFRTQISNWITGRIFVPLEKTIPAVVWKPTDDREMLEIMEGK